METADQLAIHSLVEDPERWEAMIRGEIERGRTDPEARAVIQWIYCDEDRAAAFDRFRRSPELARIVSLLDRFRIPREARICEIGGGGGWLGWALHQEGFRHLEMIEPNGCFISGTGYLRTRPDARDIRIWNDLDAWYADPGRYAAVVTRNCVHHFRSIGFVAAAIRQKVEPGGLWLMFQEWFADSPDEVYELLARHPYSQKYGVYEFPYPASHYVESLELAGFELGAVVPARYADAMRDGAGVRTARALNRAATGTLDALLGRAPGVTTRLYHTELFANRYLGRRLRHFTRPVALVFRRRTVG
jgi:hypothetical protein